MKLDLAQVRELMTNYGPIDIAFFDGEPHQLRDLAWKLQPDTVVTRGAIQTPELYVPGIPLEGAWEANFTMGTAWQYQPQNENYKTGGQVIDILVETRAKGGNLLLNIGPKPDGELPIEQEERLREVALWMQVNQECIYGVRPWVITNEQNIWFTKAKNEDTVYAIVKQQPRWVRGQWRDFVLKSVARHGPDPGQRAGPERPRAGIPARSESRAHVSSRKPTGCTSAPCSRTACRTTAAGRTRLC